MLGTISYLRFLFKVCSLILVLVCCVLVYLWMLIVRIQFDHLITNLNFSSM